MVLRAKNYKNLDRLRKTRQAQAKRYFDKTAIYKSRRWTDVEDVIVLEHKKTDMDLSKLLQRSVKAIQVRRVKLKKWEQEAVNSKEFNNVAED